MGHTRLQSCTEDKLLTCGGVVVHLDAILGVILHPGLLIGSLVGPAVLSGVCLVSHCAKRLVSG